MSNVWKINEKSDWKLGNLSRESNENQKPILLSYQMIETDTYTSEQFLWMMFACTVQ